MSLSDRIKKGLYWDRAWSLVEGCSPVSEGCLNCWSARQTSMRACQASPKIQARYEGLTIVHHTFGLPCRPKFNGKIRLMWDDLEKPLHVKKPIVWSIWNDFLLAPPSFIDAAFDVMGACPHHIFLILTKRPEKLETLIYEPTPEVPIRHLGSGDSLPNVYWGVTVELQKYIDRVTDLMKVPGKHFVSIEPCLELIDLKEYLREWGFMPSDPGLGAVILGGESGPNARPMHPDWARSVRDQCVETGVPFVFKQWGEWCPDDFLTVTPSGATPKRCWVHLCGTVYDWGYPLNTKQMMKVGKKAAGRLLDGREWNDLPWGD